VLERVKIGREVERRGGVHGAELSSELDHYSGEGFPRKGSFPRLTEASTGCARWRRSFGRDRAVDGELGWPGKPTPARRVRWWSCLRARKLLLLLSERGRGEGREGMAE